MLVTVSMAGKFHLVLKCNQLDQNQEIEFYRKLYILPFMALYLLLKFTLFFIFLFALIIPFHEMEAQCLTKIIFYDILCIV